jgi:hypothetical protein
MKLKIILPSLFMLLGTSINAQQPTNQKKTGESASKSNGETTSYGEELQTQENPKVAAGNAKEAFLDSSKKSQKDPRREAQLKKQAEAKKKAKATNGKK